MQRQKTRLSYHHVEVFSRVPLSGNGLTIFTDSSRLSTDKMQRLTQEMRQFETIFLSSTDDPRKFRARIFTMEEELDFAGHPILGAAAILHEKLGVTYMKQEEWQFELNAKTVDVTTVKDDEAFYVTMEQGRPEFGLPIPMDKQRQLLRALNLTEADEYPDLPLEVLSTGLWYLFVPIQSGLERARISVPKFESLLAGVGAKFVYVFDIPTREGRTWDNDGRVEDVATGSAAGPAGAFLIKHKLASPETEITINQGRFVGRPSQLYVRVGGTPAAITSIKVSGAVSIVASGTMEI